MSEEVLHTKRVTANFQRSVVYGPNDQQEFNKWRQQMKEQNAPVAYDKRNNIYCIAPSMDYEMYYNYLVYLNSCHKDWLNNGYFDLGMVPYLMWPSFMDNSPILEHMRDLTRRVGVNLISVPSVSLLKQSYISNGYDYWIFRDEFYYLMKTLEEINPVVQFNVTSEDDVSLTKFVEPFARMTENGGVGR